MEQWEVELLVNPCFSIQNQSKLLTKNDQIKSGLSWMWIQNASQIGS